jgi:hypothetical protein
MNGRDWLVTLAARPPVTPYYADDLVTIYHADCRTFQIPGLADAIVTDPPYGTGFDGVAGDESFPFDVLPGGLPCIAFASPKRAVDDLRSFVRPPDRVMVWAPAFSWSKQSDGGVLYKWTPIYCWNTLPTGRNEPTGDVFTEHDAGASSITKPVALMRRLLPLVPGVILDPFMGKGSTLVAAKSLGRRAIGVEIEERYCEIAANRCRQEVLGLGA